GRSGPVRRGDRGRRHQRRDLHAGNAPKIHDHPHIRGGRYRPETVGTRRLKGGGPDGNQLRGVAWCNTGQRAVAPAEGLMMTTSRLVSLDVVVPDRARGELIHLTGQVQVVARTAMDGPDSIPAQVALRLDAARVRGVGLRSGARYWAQGLHQSRHPARELATPF